MIEVEATLIAATSRATWVAKVPNGHQVAVHFSKKTEISGKELLPGEKVLLQMSACDMSRGEIISLSRSNLEKVALKQGHSNGLVLKSGFVVSEGGYPHKRHWSDGSGDEQAGQTNQNKNSVHRAET